MLSMGSIDVRGNKGEYRGNFRTSVCDQTVDSANNTLIDLFLTWNIMIEGVNGRNGVYGEPGVKTFSSIGGERRC